SDRERSFQVAVAAFDGFLGLIAEQYLLGGDVRGQVGEQGVPAVGGGFGVDRGLAGPPGEGGFAGSAAAGALPGVRRVGSGRLGGTGCLVTALAGAAAGAAGRGGRGADGVAQVGAGLPGEADLLDAVGDLLLAGVEPAAQAGDQAAQVVCGAGGGVHEDAAQPDRRVAFALGVADPERLVVVQDVPAAQLGGVLLVLVAS